MKFSITFKYSNVTFKNKETKDTVTYDSKAEGNTFTFDNVDEDVVLGIVKGIKDRKASQVFSYDNLRTNFVNVIARNKCKELYDKLDKGEWKVEDVAISTATIKDLEFTKPTMNARENLTVESQNQVNEHLCTDDEKEICRHLTGMINMCDDIRCKRNGLYYALVDVKNKYFNEDGLLQESSKRKTNESDNYLMLGEAKRMLEEAKWLLHDAADNVRSVAGEDNNVFNRIDSHANDLSDTIDELAALIEKNKGVVSEDGKEMGEADLKAEADRIKKEIDGVVEDGGDLTEYFTDQVYGTTADGRWIIGYGVYGPSGHIVVCPTCVTVCGLDSEPFGRETMKAMEEVMQMVSEGKGKKMKTNESISGKDYDLSVVIHEVLDEIDDIGISLEDGELKDKLWNVRTKLFNVLSNIKYPKRMKNSVSESKGDIKDQLEEAKFHINEVKAHTSMAKWNVEKVLGKGTFVFNKLDKLYEEAQNTFDCIDAAVKDPNAAKRKLATEGGKEQVKVEFKKTPEDGEVIAFFPETRYDGSCNPGMIMSYMHVGQHGEASVEFYNDCTNCFEEDYADLLAELEKVYDDCELVVVE